MTVLNRLRSLAERRGLVVGRASEYTLVRRDFYSPVPDLAALGDETFARRRPLHGIEFDVPAQMTWAEQHLASHVAELTAPRTEPSDPTTFNLENQAYEEGDAHIGWAMFRHLRPRRVIELGSGNSTLLIAAALGANARDGAPAEYVVADPYPADRISRALARGVAGLSEFRRIPAQEVPLADFARLERGDVLFVDTSHVIRTGGELDFIFSQVLPTLAPGVHVHFHDIWLPWEYHREFLLERGYFWSEQYLLEAFLSGNRDWRVTFATYAVLRDLPDRMRALIPGLDAGKFATSFWIERVAGA